jgi:NAD(P)-dependent dehydrogenase (short-subunit alcohol dehydrogenase family)
MGKLSGKIALVTGGSRGIGASAVRALAREGAHVIIHYGKEAAKADELAREIKGLGGKADVVGAELAAPDAALNLAKQVKEITDTLDILVLNAGTGLLAPIEETTVAEFDRLFAVNVRAPYFTLQQLLPILSDGASVVFTSSVVARAQVAGLSAYAGTKGAINTFVKQHAPVLAERNIRVNAVAPGVIETDLSSFVKSEDGRGYALGLQSLKRLAGPDDIAQAYVFLASDDSRWVTGEILETSGGTKL